ncbi:MAG TPA: hypothetical protein VH142_28250 [Polyangiaceae bacterium]|jgi:hypothetical protein|nr:hypothetical protein [Polyangiaceae bacterium]
MALIFGFLVFIAFIGGMIYLLVVYREVPGAMEMRLGVLEPLPDDIGQWKTDEDSAEGKTAVQQGLKREVRMYHDLRGGGLLGGGKLIHQARYRNRATNEITRVEPDVIVPRKRVQK